ncbi:uncharacterized protein LOC143184759 [Calliopsis andreniformis]|uniref:uncharacterized protein LOC143184759 n=1 Tax=Calliopsis andreniformis TaxID=337506 RepID=UPI003FCE5C1F
MKTEYTNFIASCKSYIRIASLCLHSPLLISEITRSIGPVLEPRLRYSIGLAQETSLFRDFFMRTATGPPRFLAASAFLSTIFAQRKSYSRLDAVSLVPVPKKASNHGIVAERRAARENSTAEIRQRELCQTVELDGAARATGSALEAEPGRGESHGGAPTGAPGQALTEEPSLRGTVIHRAERITLRGSSTNADERPDVERPSSGGSRTSRLFAIFTATELLLLIRNGQSSSAGIEPGSMNRFELCARRGEVIETRHCMGNWGCFDSRSVQ